MRYSDAVEKLVQAEHKPCPVGTGNHDGSSPALGQVPLDHTEHIMVWAKHGDPYEGFRIEIVAPSSDRLGELWQWVLGQLDDEQFDGSCEAVPLRYGCVMDSPEPVDDEGEG